MAVSAPLVLEQAAAEGALEGQLVAVDLLVALQVAQAAEGNQRETPFSHDAHIDIRHSRGGIRTAHARAAYRLNDAAPPPRAPRRSRRGEGERST